jgi:anti-sigma regulatory factor (Ser/Thr protein kinase)
LYEAPPFNPVISPELPAVSSLDEIRVGGHGIRLLRRFADALEYQTTPSGNRLSIGFSAAGPAIAKE